MKSYRLLLALLVAATLGTSSVTARDQWVLRDQAYDVDTLIFPHLVGPGVTSAKFDLPALPLKVRDRDRHDQSLHRDGNLYGLRQIMGR